MSHEGTLIKRPFVGFWVGDSRGQEFVATTDHNRHNHFDFQFYKTARKGTESLCQFLLAACKTV